MPNFKTEQLYIQRKTRRRLWILLSLYPSTFDEVLAKGRSPDDLADILINEALKERYPEVLKLEKEQDKLEADMALKIRCELPEAHHAEA